MHDLASFLSASTPLARAVHRFVSDNDLMDKVDIDHFCYKCDSADQFEHLRTVLGHSATFVYQSWISGRRIALIRLAQPFESLVGDTHLLELSDQKPDGSQKGGFDHIEVLPRNGTYDELKESLSVRGVHAAFVDRPHHSTDDYKLPGGFTFRLTREFLLDKVKREEMKY